MSKGWDDFFMDMCDMVAGKSKDTSIKVGCVIAGPDNEVRSIGINGFPRGAIDDESVKSQEKYQSLHSMPKRIMKKTLQIVRSLILRRQERPLKYLWTEHAERNALYNAAGVGIPTRGCTLYVNSLPPCTDCARGIIQSRIATVVYPEGIDIPDRWKDNCDVACEMLLECGVNIRTVKRERK